MLAPEPFFEPRGTPFSEYHRIKALGELGHRIDLVTYPIGRDVALPNLRIFRALRPPFVGSVLVFPFLEHGQAPQIHFMTTLADGSQGCLRTHTYVGRHS